MRTERTDVLAAVLRVQHETACDVPDVRAEAEETALVADVLQIVNGKVAALAALHDSTVTRLYSLACSVLRCPYDAEEVVCDVFLFVWRNAHRYDASRGSVMGWLAIITRSRSLDRIRQRRHRLSMDDEQASPALPSLAVDAESLEERLGRLQASSRVFRVLALQSPVRRQLIALAFFEGLCHADIATATGLPLGSVKSHIRRALKSMRATLEIAH